MKNFFKKHRQVSVNSAVFCVALLLSLIVAELILRNFTRLGRFEQKVKLRTKDQIGHCYSSNYKDYFDEVQMGVSPLLDKYVEKGFKYCVFYDIGKREAGFFPERKQDVVLVGDSFVFGEGLKEQDTLGYLLGSRMTAYNFKNYGQPGYEVDNVALSILKIIKEKSKPKAVIYFYNLNDAFMSKKIRAEQKFINDFQNIRWRKANLPVGQGAPMSVIWGMLEQGRLMKKETRLTINYYNDVYFAPANSQEIARTLDILKAMQDDLGRRGIKFIVVINPLYYKDRRGNYPFLAIHRFLMDACKEKEIMCFDALKAFRKYRSMRPFTVHPVDYHPNRAANEMIIDYLMSQDEFVTAFRKD